MPELVNETVEEPLPSPMGDAATEAMMEAFADEPADGSQTALEEALEARHGEEDDKEPVAEEPKPVVESSKVVPEWSKPVQQVQQEVANIKKAIDSLIAKLDANPTAANQQAAKEKLDEHKDQLEELEKEMGDEASPAIKKLLAVVKGIKNHSDDLAVKLETAQKTISKTTEAQERAKRVESEWQSFGKDHPKLGRNGGESLMRECIQELADNDFDNDRDRAFAIERRFWMKVGAAEATPAPTDPAPKKPAADVSPSGGRMASPVGRSPGGSPPAPKSLEDQVRSGKFRLAESFS